MEIWTRLSRLLKTENARPSQGSSSKIRDKKIEASTKAHFFGQLSKYVRFAKPVLEQAPACRASSWLRLLQWIPGEQEQGLAGCYMHGQRLRDKLGSEHSLHLHLSEEILGAANRKLFCTCRQWCCVMRNGKANSQAASAGFRKSCCKKLVLAFCADPVGMLH